MARRISEDPSWVCRVKFNKKDLGGVVALYAEGQQKPVYAVARKQYRDLKTLFSDFVGAGDILRVEDEDKMAHLFRYKHEVLPRGGEDFCVIRTINENELELQISRVYVNAKGLFS